MLNESERYRVTANGLEAKSLLLIAEDKWNKQNNIRTSSLAINKQFSKVKNTKFNLKIDVWVREACEYFLKNSRTPD